MAKAIWLMFAHVNLRAKLSRHASAIHRLKPKHVFVLCLKNSLILKGGYCDEWDDDTRGVRTDGRQFQ